MVPRDGGRGNTSPWEGRVSMFEKLMQLKQAILGRLSKASARTTKILRMRERLLRRELNFSKTLDLYVRREVLRGIVSRPHEYGLLFMYEDEDGMVPIHIRAWELLAGTYPKGSSERKRCEEEARRVVDELQHLERGARALLSRRFYEAIQYFKEALSLNTKSTTALVNMAYAHLLENKTSEAEMILKRAKKLDPDNPEVWELLAHLYESLKKPESARRCYERLEKLYSNALMEYEEDEVRRS